MSSAEAVTNFWGEVDNRTVNWFLTGSPTPILIILGAYAYYVYVYGPNSMKSRQEYSLKGFIKLYNIFQIVANSWLVYNLFTHGWMQKPTFGCSPINNAPHGSPYELAKVMWWTYMLKVVDLIETVMYILRKKSRQVSFLHVYHHISTVLITYAITKFYPGGVYAFAALLNNGVHVIMYTYYLLSAEQGFKKFTNPIKPYITILQMVQFVVLIISCSIALIPSCSIPKALVLALLVDVCINLILFYTFYQNQYKGKKKGHAAK